MEKKNTEMSIEYKGKEYVLELLFTPENHHGIIHINDDVKIKFTRNQNKSIQIDFAEKMKEYFSNSKAEKTKGRNP